MKVIKALLFTMLLFVGAFAVAAVPVLFGSIGTIISLTIIFFVTAFCIFLDM